MGDGEGGGREGEGEKGRKDTKIRYRWKFCLHHSDHSAGKAEVLTLPNAHSPLPVQLGFHDFWPWMRGYFSMRF